MTSTLTAARTDWLVWQLVDSAFPTGGFVHSVGLESAWQHGEVMNRDGLQGFVRAGVLQTIHGVIPLLTAAYRSPERLAELDQLNDAFLTNVVANRASRLQGRTLVSTVGRIWPGAESERLSAAVTGLRAHLAPLTGVVLRRLDVPLDVTERIVLFCAVRGMLSAAVRLGIVGSYEAQQLQAECGAWSLAALEACEIYDETALAHTAPVLDLLQGAHDRLYSRLFQS